MINRVLAAAFTLLALTAPFADATTLARVELSELYADAHIVAEVQIASGESLGMGRDSCGAKYKARVEVAFKGAQAGELIEFGYFHGYEIGSRYILFLSRHEREYSASTNSRDMADAQASRARCSRHLTVSSVMHSGNGALLVNWASQLQFKDGVLVRTRYVRLPEGTKTEPAVPGENEQFSDPVWVRLTDFERILHDFGK